MNIDFKFYAITDRKKLSGDRLLFQIETAFASGLKALQIREKDLPPDELFRLGEQTKKIALRYNGKIFINDRVDVMLALDLDGVHLTERSLPIPQVRKMIGYEKHIGVSVHTAEKLETAYRASADFAVFGPVAATLSKPEGHTIVTPETFKAACAGVPLPVFALGGVTVKTAGLWLERGAHGIAGISIWMDAPDVAAQLKQLEKVLEHL